MGLMQGAAWLAAQCAAMDCLAMAHTGPDMGHALFGVEALLAKACVMCPKWVEQGWQARWRAAAAQCPDMRTALMLTVTLQVGWLSS